MRLVSPRGIAYNLLALMERPLRRRHHSKPQQSVAAPPDAWWAADDRWSPVDTPPRHGNRLIPLVDGQEGMRAMYDALEGARESIQVASWFLTPPFQLVRDGTMPPQDDGPGPDDLVDLLARKANEVDVRVLLWPGSGLGKFRHSKVRETHRALCRANPKLRARLDTHERFSHCHHQKAIVVDGRVAFVGGLDPTNFDVDRWDLSTHPFRQGLNWHDAHWRIEGPCVADVASNFRQRWDALAPHDPAPAAAMPAPLPDGVDAQVQRTIPAGVYPFAPSGIAGIAHAYRHALAHASRFIYLENQYLWSPEITDALCEAMERGVRTVLVLPAHPNIGKGDTDRQVEQLQHADKGRGLLGVYTLYTSWRDEQSDQFKYRPIYVHAKVAVIDDAWVTAGSANLNGRGMATDTEMNLSSTDGAMARSLRLRLWSEHLGWSEEDLRDLDPVTLLGGAWKTVAEEQQRMVKKRSGLLSAALYPYPLGHVDADFGPGELKSALLDR